MKQLSENKIKKYRIELIALAVGLSVGAIAHLGLFQRKPTVLGIAKACALGAISSVAGAQFGEWLKRNKGEVGL